MRWRFLAMSLVWAYVLEACIPLSSELRSRAASDFGCTYDQVEVRQLAAGAWRASGCDQWATYVCDKQKLCVQNGPRSGPPTAAAEPTNAPSEHEASPKTVEKVAHDGVVFELPPGFWLDEKAKAETYRDGKRHHAARLTIEKSSATEADWVASHYPEAKTWTAKIGERELTFASKVGSSLRITVAVIADKGRVFELACSSDDVTSEKTDAVCTKVLGSFRLKEPEGGLPGE